MNRDNMARAFVAGFLLICMATGIQSYGGATPQRPIGQSPIYTALSNFLINVSPSFQSSGTPYNIYTQATKQQTPWPRSQRFFCDLSGPGRRSRVPPRSVHQLRPGDIDIIGALGASLVAGTAALATTVTGWFVENKGVSWANGGQSDWRQFLTLPNILKEFNPQLYGYSVRDSTADAKSAVFNMAFPGATSSDVLKQTTNLIGRMRDDVHVNIADHWKMITIYVGINDFCMSSCRQSNPYRLVEAHAHDLITILRMLRDNLPRTMVNIVVTTSMKVLFEMRNKSTICAKAHVLECNCLFGSRSKSQRQTLFDVMEKWQAVEETVANLKEFHDKEDFTVNVQPFIKNTTFPMLDNGHTDYTYWSIDCFHWSQKGYAAVANGLWNSFWEPVGAKSITLRKEFAEVKCPTDAHPYIRTIKN